MRHALGTMGLVAVLLGGAPLSAQEECWDNDVDPNGLNGRPTSPPEFPDTRATDDFVVTGDDPWLLCGIHVTHVEDDDWRRGTLAEVYVYDDGGECPDTLIGTRLTPRFAANFEDFQLFDRDVYSYWIAFDCLELDPGVHHIGTRFPNATGNGTTYWISSDGGEGTERPGCYSLDGGATWMREGADGHRAFELVGDCGAGNRGACCFEDGACLELTEALCETVGGLYRGNGVACEDADCPPPPTGACCLAIGACLRVTEDECQAIGGLYRGDGVPCVNADCPQLWLGACCFDDRPCERLTREDCAAGGGFYRGNDTTCEDIECPPPTPGACCFLTKGGEQCASLSEVACGRVFGVFRGAGTTCGEADCLDDLRWDNGIVPDGSNWARAISPPVFPDIRVADDFTVPEGETWTAVDLRFHVIEDAGWISGGVLQLLVYEDGAADCPGDILIDRLIGYDQTFMGIFFSRDTYTYFLDPVEIVLGPGHYWLGIRNPFAAGVGTNYWGSGDGAGRDGPGSSTGCFSLDAGKNWLDEGQGWQHAFQIRGICGCPECDADFDGDCDVGFNDLLVLLAGWGPCSPNNDCFDQDLDGDGAVTFDDLLLLLAAWGPCDG